MAEPTLPLGVTVAGFIMAVLSWYAMVRTGIQCVHDDLKNRKRFAEDITRIKDDLEHQENRLVSWRRTWHISDKTPDENLIQIWGEGRFRLISNALLQIEQDTSRAKDTLGGMLQKEWNNLPRLKRKWHVLTFVMAKKKYVQDLINKIPKSLATVIEEANTGWEERKSIVSQGIAKMTPEHYQVARLLVDIAMRDHADAEELLDCCQRVEPSVTVLLDLDVFDTFRGTIENRPVEQVTQIFDAERLKLELLLRRTEQWHADLTRAIVEKVSVKRMPTNTAAGAFEAAIKATDTGTYHFTCDTSTCFRLTNTYRAGVPSYKLRKTFLDILAEQDIPKCDHDTPEIINRHIAFEDLSRSRAAFELTQVCLLFSRTSWLNGLCHCGFRCEELTHPLRGKCYHFGLDFVNVAHSLPRWRNVDLPTGHLLGEQRHVWCTDRTPWDNLHKPIRCLGLLLLEVTLGTIVWPMIDDFSNGTARVTGVFVYARPVREECQGYEEKSMSLDNVLSIVKVSFNGSDLVAAAVKYCFETIFPPNPYDKEWREHLTIFYYKVVKPFKDIYRMRLTDDDDS